MRITVLTLAVLLAGTAHAQFAHRSFGGGVSFVKFTGGSATTGLDFAIPVALEGSLYIENGFDVYLQVPLMIVRVKAGGPRSDGTGEVFGTGGHLGVRYLFLQETIRPYAGLELAGVVLLTNPTVIFAGPGASAGIDWFVADTISLGARGFFDLFLELNAPLRPSFGGGLSFAAYF